MNKDTCFYVCDSNVTEYVKVNANEFSLSRTMKLYRVAQKNIRNIRIRYAAE